MTSSAEDAASRFLTILEAAAFLHVSVRTIRRFIANGQLAVIRLGRAVRVERKSLEILIKRSAWHRPRE